MLGVDPRIFVWLVGELVCSTRLEQGIVRIKHLAGQDLEPLSGHTASINAFFVIESDAELAILDLVSRLPLQVLETILEDARSTNIELKGSMVFSGMWPSVQLLCKIVPLVVKVENSRVVDQERERPAHQ